MSKMEGTIIRMPVCDLKPSQDIVAHWDAGLRGRLIDGVPPHAACGAIVEGSHTYVQRVRYLGSKPINESEWSGLILVLQIAFEIGLRTGDRLSVYGDSQLVCRQFSGEYRVKEPRLAPYKKEADRLASMIRSRGCSVSVSHVRREMNKEADAIVGRYLDNIC